MGIYIAKKNALNCLLHQCSALTTAPVLVLQPSGNMRLVFNGLSGIVTDQMGMSLRDGDMFVFVNANRNRMKILHRTIRNEKPIHQEDETAFTGTLKSKI